MAAVVPSDVREVAREHLSNANFRGEHRTTSITCALHFYMKIEGSHCILADECYVQRGSAALLTYPNKTVFLVTASHNMQVGEQTYLLYIPTLQSPIVLFRCKGNRTIREETITIPLGTTENGSIAVDQKIAEVPKKAHIVLHNSDKTMQQLTTCAPIPRKTCVML